MHDSARKQLAEFIKCTGNQWPNDRAADLGALELSGSVKEQLPDAVGFDIVSGKCVDVVIEPGTIPAKHCGRYGAVTSISSFQFCSKPTLYRDEVHALLCKGGWCMVTMCGDGCRREHSTSTNPYGWGDELRWPLSRFTLFWDTVFTTIRVAQLETGHRDMIYWGRKV